MIIKYRTGGIREEQIEPIEIERETEKCVWVKSVWNGRITINRESKYSDYCQYFDTWDEAKAYLLEKAEKRVEDAKRKLELAKSTLGNINGLRKEI